MGNRGSRCLSSQVAKIIRTCYESSEAVRNGVWRGLWGRGCEASYYLVAISVSRSTHSSGFTYWDEGMLDMGIEEEESSKRFDAMRDCINFFIILKSYIYVSVYIRPDAEPSNPQPNSRQSNAREACMHAMH